MPAFTKSLAAVLLASAAAHASAAPATDVEHTTRSFLNALNGSKGTPLQAMPPVEARKVFNTLYVPAAAPNAPADVEQKVIQVNGQDLTLTIVRPAGVKGVLPAFMYFHGGGWVLGDFASHEHLVRELVAQSGAVAVFVNYTPSPEAHFPVPTEQAYAATQWVATHGSEINIDGSRLAVAGNSVGGNMAAVVTLMAKAKGTPALRYQVLLWPVISAKMNTASYKSFGSGYFLSSALQTWFWNSYLPDANQRKQLFADPSLATNAQLTGLPAALVETADFDPVRDEGEAYGRSLSNAGVDVTSVRYAGTIHEFASVNPLNTLPASKSAISLAAHELQEHLK